MYELVRAIRGIYDKLELLLEGYDPFSIYDGKRRWNGGRVPKSPLVLDKLNLGLDSTLRIHVHGTVEVEDVITLLNLLSSIFSAGASGHWWYTKDRFEKTMRRFPPDVTRESMALTTKYDLSLERLLGYIGPEIKMVQENGAKPA